jgi:hypothetical protein
MSQPTQAFNEAPMTIRERVECYLGPPQLMLKAAYCEYVPIIPYAFFLN